MQMMKLEQGNAEIQHVEEDGKMGRCFSDISRRLLFYLAPCANIVIASTKG